MKLSDAHQKMLYENSGISPDVAAERGYYTARRGADVPQDAGKLPNKPGLIIPVRTLDGGIFYRLRLNNPGKLPKYMQPKGQPNRLDVHPRQHAAIRQPGGMRYVTEGEKKVDAGVGRGLLMIGMSGVWNGQKDKALIPDWDLLPMRGEDHSITFDSDILTNPNVQQAADRMARLLRERGANVFITVLPAAPDSSKQGLDDFFANGGTVKELRLLTRPYEAFDVARIRLSRDERLRAGVEDLERRWWNEEWKGRGGHSKRDVYLKLIEAARRSGKIHADGIRVRMSWGELQVAAKVARKTLGKALARLEGRGLLYRDNEGRKDDRTGAFVLRAKVDQYGKGNASQEKATKPLQVSFRDGLPLRAPRLRWSRPAFTPRRGFVSGTRKVRESKPRAPRERIERLGKIRGAVVDALEVAGGTLTLQELCEDLHRKRPRDVRRRILPMLEDAGIIETVDDVITLAADWTARLDEARAAGGELEADEQAEAARKRKSRAYHQRNAEANSEPSAEGVAAIKRSHEKRAEHIAEHDEQAAAARAAEIKAKSFAKRYVHDRLRALGRIRLGLLQDILRDEGGMPAYAEPAAKSLGCTIERLPEYSNEPFVYAPREWAS